MPYVYHLINTIGIFVILAASLNLLVGYTGLFSLGHAAFYGIGAYTAAMLALKVGWPFWLTLPAAALSAAFFGLVVGIPSLRLKGDFLALATFAFGVVVFLILNNWVTLTRGPMGLPGVPRPSLGPLKFSTEARYVFLVLFLDILVFLSIWMIGRAPFGRVLKAIRENERAISTLGRNVAIFKLKAFTLSSLFAGVAGAMFAHYATFVSPDSFYINESFFVLAIILVGGLGDLTGAVVGTMLLVGLPEGLRFVGLPPPATQMIFGLAMVVTMLKRPQGILGKQRA